MRNRAAGVGLDPPLISVRDDRPAGALRFLLAPLGWLWVRRWVVGLGRGVVVLVVRSLPCRRCRFVALAFVVGRAACPWRRLRTGRGRVGNRIEGSASSRWMVFFGGVVPLYVGPGGDSRASVGCA
jgi:hypothetical protein